MKKHFLLLSILYFLSVLNIHSIEPVKKFNKNDYIKIKIIDKLTREPLVGVKLNNNYTDFDGFTIIEKCDTIEISYISYEKIKISTQDDIIVELQLLNNN